MANNINGNHKETNASGQKLQTVTTFKYMGAIISDVGFKADFLSRIAHPRHSHPSLRLRDMDRGESRQWKLDAIVAFCTFHTKTIITNAILGNKTLPAIVKKGNYDGSDMWSD